MKERIESFVRENIDEVERLIRELCMIPAPSGHEEKRAEYCKNWFLENHMEGAYIDGALNVVYPYQDEGGDDLTVIAAHTDTVFPDTEPMPYVDDGEYIRSPGVGDDTASLAVLLLVAKYFHENKIPTRGVLFVCNSSEEGLGNLKGTRSLFESYAGRIGRFISFDASNFTHAVDKAVGSHRYEVTVTTEGGHSYGRFGNPNAIAVLSGIISRIYEIDLPQKEGKKVTYNVGTVEGGTSVNTIAQSATMLCEYRSDDRELLGEMEARFGAIFREARTEGVEVTVKLVGDRPCAKEEIDEEEMARLRRVAAETVRPFIEKEMKFVSGSTDGNIPLAQGISALTVGVYRGKGAHTREEYLWKDSLPTGLFVGIMTVLGVVE